jgi:Zn-dependent M16 (insulinase) family peptidase
MPLQVNYVAKGANLYDLGYHLHGSIAVMTNYMRTTWLWERVRVQGGAYGAFCLFDRHSGLFNFSSYRDPNLLATLEVYDQTSQFLSQLELSETDLTRGIIGAISQVDAYQLPDAKGYTSLLRYLIGETDPSLQRWREEILATRPADFRAFAEVLAQVNRQGLVVVLGSPEAIEAANSARPGWLQVLKVL